MGWLINLRLNRGTANTTFIYFDLIHMVSGKGHLCWQVCKDAKLVWALNREWLCKVYLEMYSMIKEHLVYWIMAAIHNFIIITFFFSWTTFISIAFNYNWYQVIPSKYPSYLMCAFRMKSKFLKWCFSFLRLFIKNTGRSTNNPSDLFKLNMIFIKL